MARYGKLAAVAALALSGAVFSGVACQHHDAPKAQACAVDDSTATNKADSHMASAGITKSDFGKTKDGQSVDLYELSNSNGTIAKIMTYGAIITELHAADKAGKKADVV